MSARALGLLLAFAAGRRGRAERTLVDAARNGDHAAAVALLAERADPNQAESDGTTPLHWAVHHDDAELVARLLEAGAERRAPPTTTARRRCRKPPSRRIAAVLEALLDAGADVDSPNADGQTALMVVARGGNTAAARAADRARRRRQRARAAQGPDGADVGRRRRASPRWSKLLLEHGAEVDARSTVNEWERMVTAEPRQKNLMPGGFTPLLVRRAPRLPRVREAARRGRRRRRSHGSRRRHAAAVSALLNAHFDTAKYLLEAGANVNKWDFWGRTPLYAAVDFNTLPHGGRPDRPSLDDTTSARR